jgi:uncharacterized protein (TIGR03083 family)
MEPSIDDLYHQAAHSFAELATQLDDDDWATPVGCCPGWTARDVLSHVSGVADDIIHGRVDGAGTSPWTAAQVERNREFTVAELMERWTGQVDRIAEILDQFSEFRPPMDTQAHEHDIRAAVGKRGNRDNAIITATAARFRQMESTPPVTILLENDESRPAPTDGLVVRGLTRWELVRSRLGRRSRRQVAGYDWSGDPTPVLDDWFVFGPNEHDIIE